MTVFSYSLPTSKFNVGDRVLILESDNWNFNRVARVRVVTDFGTGGIVYTVGIDYDGAVHTFAVREENLQGVA